MSAFKQFFSEFWLWILIPALFVGIGVVVLILMSGEGSSPFAYNVF